MSQSSQHGKQAQSLQIMRDKLNSGVNFSHILNVKVGLQGSNKDGNAIRRSIFKKLHDQKIPVDLNDDTVRIKWIAVITKSKMSAYYYTDSIYTDHVTAQHVKHVFSELIAEIRAEIGGSWKVVYFISRRLNYGNTGPAVIEEFVSGEDAASISVAESSDEEDNVAREEADNDEEMNG